MQLVKLAALAVGLGADAMSVCVVVGVRWHGARQRLRLAWHMGLFQFLMPILGWLAGKELANLLRDVGHYVAAVLVFTIGGKMFYEALRSHPGAVVEEAEHLAKKELRLRPRDPTRGWSLFILSVATSIDALVVGFSLGLKKSDIWTASIVIGLVAAGMALLGVAVGKRLGSAFGKWAELFGAVVLMGLGVTFLWL